jgi:hypothetical protein
MQDGWSEAILRRKLVSSAIITPCLGTLGFAQVPADVVRGSFAELCAHLRPELLEPWLLTSHVVNAALYVGCSTMVRDLRNKYAKRNHSLSLNPLSRLTDAVHYSYMPFRISSPKKWGHSV